MFTSLVTDGRTDGRTNEKTNTQPENINYLPVWPDRGVKFYNNEKSKEIIKCRDVAAMYYEDYVIVFVRTAQRVVIMPILICIRVGDSKTHVAIDSNI